MNEIQKPKKIKSISLIWILPLIILLFVGWSEYNNFIAQQDKIILLSDDASGLKINVTPLEYKGLNIGKVTDISINKDLKSAVVTLTIDKKAMPLVTKKGNLFWVEKPRVSINKISGLSTIISGYKIKIKPNLETNQTSYKFKLLNNPPLEGTFIKLKTNQNININAPILYKGIKIGEVIDKKFENGFILTAIIYPESTKFINNSSIFIKNPILKIDPKGLNVKIDSLSEVLLGSISVITPKKEKFTKKEFYIYKNKDEVLPKINIDLIIKDNFSIKKNTPIIYHEIQIGAIKKTILKNTQLIAKAYIYDKYKHLLNDNSEFILQKPEVSLNGVKNLKNIIFGNYIYLIPNKGKLTKHTFNVYQYNLNTSNTIVLNLYTDTLHSISKNSKIYYKNIPIGQVLDYYFTPDFKKIKIIIGIKKQYKPLLNNNSMFYDISSKLAEFKNMNININFEGLNPLVNGGIALVTTPNKKLTKKSFKLYHSYQDIEEMKKLKYKGFIKQAYFSNDFKLYKNMNIEYKNQTIGFIKNIKYKDSNQSIASLFIYNKYKNLFNNHSILYKQPAINLKANISGIDIKIDNLTSLLKGSIILTYTPHRYKNLSILPSLQDIKKQDAITIVFNDAEGIKIGSTIEYKGLKVGKVIDIKLKNNKTIIKALVNKEFQTKNTIFYLKKPIISLNEVKNVSSLISLNIGIIKGDGEYTKIFKGYEKKPLKLITPKGKIFKIYANKATQSINSPIYYKNVQIGKIVKIDLTDDATKVVLFAFINKKYLKLIRKNSEFYDISGIDMEFSMFSTHIKTHTFTSIIKGGILVVTPLKYSNEASIVDSFELLDTLPKNWQNISPKIP